MQLLRRNTSRVARLHEYVGQTVICAVKKTKKTKGEYKEKPRALLKVWPNLFV